MKNKEKLFIDYMNWYTSEKRESVDFFIWIYPDDVENAYLEELSSVNDKKPAELYKYLKYFLELCATHKVEPFVALGIEVEGFEPSDNKWKGRVKKKTLLTAAEKKKLAKLKK